MFALITSYNSLSQHHNSNSSGEAAQKIAQKQGKPSKHYKGAAPKLVSTKGSQRQSWKM